MAIRIDAAADRLTHNGSYPQTTLGWTMTAWVRIQVDRNDYSTWMRLSQTDGTIATLGTESDGTSGPNYFTPDGSAVISAPMSSPTTGVWVPVAASRNPSTGAIKVYVKPSGTGSTTSATQALSLASIAGTPDQICIGGRGSADASEWFNGDIMYPRVWGAELTQTEIETEWASPTRVRTSNLVEAWTLATATDLTGINGRTLAVQSGGAITTVADGPLSTANNGVVAGSFPTPGGSLAGAVRTNGVVAGSLPTPTGTLSGSNRGALTGSLPAPVGALAGTVRTSGVLAGALPTPAGQTAGNVIAPGAVAGSLPPLGGSLAGGLATPGSVAGALPALGGSLTGSVTLPGQLSGEFPAFSGALTGLVRVLGIVRGSLPSLGGSLNDVVTLLTQDQYALDVHRENTRAFIRADPTSITLRTRTAERTALGGRIMTDGTFRSPQIGKLIMISPAGGSIEQRTDDGTERQVDYILLLEWDAEIEVGDWWDDTHGNRWEVKAIVPTNNYEIRAVVEAHGKVLTGG